MAKLILIFTIFIMSGCTLFCNALCPECEPITNIEYRDVYKEKPVLPGNIPEFKSTAELNLPIYLLPSVKESDPNKEKKTSEYYYQSVIMLIGEVNRRDNVLNEFREFEKQLKLEGEK